MSKIDKRVTRDMRLTMLKIHNDLKDIKNTIEECNDIWLSDLQKLNGIIHTLHSEFDLSREIRPTRTTRTGCSQRM